MKRFGQSWSEQEDSELVDAIAEFIMRVSREHERTEAAIATRVARHLDGAKVAKAIKRIKNETYYS